MPGHLSMPPPLLSSEAVPGTCTILCTYLSHGGHMIVMQRPCDYGMLHRYSEIVMVTCIQYRVEYTYSMTFPATLQFINSKRFGRTSVPCIGKKVINDNEEFVGLSVQTNFRSARHESFFPPLFPALKCHCKRMPSFVQNVTLHPPISP